ncbi:MAG: hypothetical protein WD336_06075 [Trueperaceae bacterium]
MHPRTSARRHPFPLLMSALAVIIAIAFAPTTAFAEEGELPALVSVSGSEDGRSVFEGIVGDDDTLHLAVRPDIGGFATMTLRFEDGSEWEGVNVVLGEDGIDVIVGEAFESLVSYLSVYGVTSIDVEFGELPSGDGGDAPVGDRDDDDDFDDDFDDDDDDFDDDDDGDDDD